MSKTGLLFTVRMLCVYSLVCCITLGYAPIVYGNPLLKGIRDKASVLELMLRKPAQTTCKSYVRDAYEAFDKDEHSNSFYLLSKYIDEKCDVESVNEVVWRRFGIMYEMGIGTPQDVDIAIHYYTKSAERNDPIAQYYLGDCFIVHKNDYENGIAWLKRAAHNGEVYAQYTLGTIYDDDKKPYFNLKEAFKFFEMGAKQGDVDCSYNLGLMYYYGDGTVEDIDKAVDLLQYAAERGEEDAAHYLSGVLFNDYEPTEELLEEAYLWLEVSKHFESGLNEDGELEKRLLSKLSPELKARVDARLPKVYSEIENRKKGL